MTTRKIVNLALQGGGAHGAYTWGVLDRLAEEERLVIEGISGTSAGAINGAVFIDGLMKKGAAGAKQQLETFWRRVSEAGAWTPMHKASMPQFFTGWDMDSSPGYRWFDMLSRVVSPYMFNPLNINPMRVILEDMLDFKRMHTCTDMKLFVAATHVASGQAHVFSCDEMTTDILLASACIPFLFQAVEVDGEFYWDGGYMGNPALWPLIYRCDSKDLILVQINPLRNDVLPRSSNEIINRLNEITFNSSLISEMRAIDFVSRLIEAGRLSEEEYKNMRVHLIYPGKAMDELNASSKMNTDWDFFLFLRDMGREAADSWLKKNWRRIGVKPSVDIRETFHLGRRKKLPGGLKKRAHKKK